MKFISVFALGAAAQQFDFDEAKYSCGVCMEMRDQSLPCELFGSCAVVNETSVASGCDRFCGRSGVPTPVGAATPEIRVTKAFGTKDYNLVRVSVISDSATAPVADFFDYSDKFAYKWDGNYLHSALKAAEPGAVKRFDVGVPIDVRLPEQGKGVVGALIADPCMGSGSIVGWVGCFNAKKYQTNTRIVELINTFVPDASTDFWGIFGDNFYDRTGKITADVFSRISTEAKSKVFMTVPGNHDYWVLGSPDVASTADQCANGHMQYYAQDSKAAEAVLPGSTEAPFNLTVDPGAHRLLGCNLPAIENSFWYNQIGNLGIVGQSGAYSLEESMPLMKEACAWLGAQPGIEVAMLVGHWDDPGLGADKEMAMPQWYEEMAQLPGCQELDSRGMLKFVMGHTHCNDPHPHGKVGAGFRVAGFGMEGCNDFGMPLVDTTEDRVRFWYFDTSSDELYANVTSCAQAKGWRACTDLATLWLDEPIVKQTIAV